MAELKVKIANKRTREMRVLSLEEFKKEFSKELQTAVKLYSEAKERKDFMPFRNKDYESDFYFPGSLRFNFNNYAHFCEWYIENFV